MSYYYEWNTFKNIYLEDSFVLGISESKEEIFFTVEMVLTKDHPLYFVPGPEEQYCYKEGKIIFTGLQNVKWLKRNHQSFIDANDSEDYGNIDLFELSPEGYHLVGDWGEVVINSNPPILMWSRYLDRVDQKIVKSDAKPPQDV